MDKDEAPWAAERIVARLEQRAEELGRSPSSLMEAGGVDKKTLRTIASGHSPRLNTLVGLSRGFQIDLGDLLGLNSKSPAKCDPQILRAAIAVAGAVIGKDLACPLVSSADLVTASTFSAYQMWLSALKTDPNALSNSMVWDIIEDKLRVELPSNDRDKS